METGAGDAGAVFDRDDGALQGAYEAEPCFSFHHVNAFERERELIVDMAAYEDAAIVDSLYMDRLRTAPPPPSAQPRLRRYRLSLDHDRVAEEQLSDSVIELPRIDYASATAVPTATSTGSASATIRPSLDFVNELTKVDVESGECPLVDRARRISR